jgi:hypothetical protein
MSYIGQTLPTDVFGGYATDTFAGDGSATTFTLSQAPFNEQGLIVVINNVIQQPTTNYTVSGTTLTIVGTAVASGDVIYARHTGVALPIGEANALDLQGQSDKLILDADADTTISADTDDQIDFKAGGTDVMSMTATGLTINDGTTITTADNTDTLTLKSTDADANSGPNLRLARDSSSPADGDVIGQILFTADDDAGNATDFFSISGNIRDASNGDEDVQMVFYGFRGGSSVNYLEFDGDHVVFNEGSSDIDFRVESDNIANAFFVNGANGYVNIGTNAGVDELTIHDPNAAQSYLRLTTNVSGETNSDGFLVGLSTNNALIINYEPGALIFYTNSTEHFRIASNGDLTATDTSISSNSDSRLKENIADYTYDISKFKQFQAKTFDWKNPEEHNSKTGNRGFIAQEVAAIDDYWTDQIPIDSNKEDAKLIDADSDGNHMAKTLKLGKKDAMYISVIQQLITRIEALEDA